MTVVLAVLLLLLLNPNKTMIMKIRPIRATENKKKATVKAV